MKLDLGWAAVIATVFLAALKLAGAFAWSWWVVAAPVLIVFGFAAIVMLIGLALLTLATIITALRR